MSLTVFITGATSGIGKATAEFLAQHNYRLILCGRNKEQLQNLEKSLGKQTDVITLQFDVRNKKVFVGDKKDLLVSSFYLEDASFVNIIENENLAIQTRYNSEDLPCEINMISDNQVQVSLLEPTFGVAPGQFGVLYSGTKLIGGGRISTKLNEPLSV